MDPPETEQDYNFDSVDADAVCEQCGSVNPEGTLLCHDCGNNLRDQRKRRLTTGEADVPVAGGPSGVRLFTGALTTLGILLILVVVLNIQKLEAVLVDMQDVDENDLLVGLWEGSESAVYDKLLRELKKSPSPRSDLLAALENPAADDTYDGRYALAWADSTGSDALVGEANLTRMGDKLYFVVASLDPTVEVRGYAVLEGDEERPTVRDTVAVRVGRRIFTTFGYAEKEGAGNYICVGETDYDAEEQRYRILAKRLKTY